MAPDRVSATTKTTATGLTKAVSLSSHRAYVTFLAGDGDYVKGVVGLAKGLRKVKTAYPLVVAVLPDVPEEHLGMLVGQGCIVREIEPVQPPENGARFAWAYYAINYSKLRLWEVIKGHAFYRSTDDHSLFNLRHVNRATSFGRSHVNAVRIGL